MAETKKNAGKLRRRRYRKRAKDRMVEAEKLGVICQVQVAAHTSVEVIRNS